MKMRMFANFRQPFRAGGKAAVKRRLLCVGASTFSKALTNTRSSRSRFPLSDTHIFLPLNAEKDTGQVDCWGKEDRGGGAGMGNRTRLDYKMWLDEKQNENTAPRTQRHSFSWKRTCSKVKVLPNFHNSIDWGGQKQGRVLKHYSWQLQMEMHCPGFAKPYFWILLNIVTSHFLGFC